MLKRFFTFVLSHILPKSNNYYYTWYWDEPTGAIFVRYGNSGEYEVLYYAKTEAWADELMETSRFKKIKSDRKC